MEFSRPESPSPRDLPNPGIEPRSPADALPAEPQEETKNTEVGSLSLLQQIFPTQESNRGLLHCRRIFLPTELSKKTSILKTYLKKEPSKHFTSYISVNLS